MHAGRCVLVVGEVAQASAVGLLCVFTSRRDQQPPPPRTPAAPDLI
jgi:hypothetical protein